MRFGWFYCAMMICQANACLDLLTRSFNEVFSPIIETGNGRINKPHNVDDLTYHYRADEYGNIIPNFDMVSEIHDNNRKPNAMDVEEMLLSPRNGVDTSDDKVGCRTTPAPGTSDEIPGPSDQQWGDVVTPTYNQNGLRKRKKYRGGYYEPGKRPLVDFLIKLIETFQLTASSKFITSRPRYENSQLHYVPDTYHDIY